MQIDLLVTVKKVSREAGLPNSEPALARYLYIIVWLKVCQFNDFVHSGGNAIGVLASC